MIRSEDGHKSLLATLKLMKWTKSLLDCGNFSKTAAHLTP